MNDYFLSLDKLFINKKIKTNEYVEMDFYEFLGIKSSASIEDIINALTVKKRVLEEHNKVLQNLKIENSDINMDIINRLYALDVIEASLIENIEKPGSKNRQIYDKRLQEAKEKRSLPNSLSNRVKSLKSIFKISKHNAKFNTRGFNINKFKKVFIPVLVGTVTFSVAVGCAATGVNIEELNKENVTTYESIEEDMSNIQSYVDEDDQIVNDKQILDYVIESGDYSKSIVAEKLGVSVEDCEFLNEFKPEINYVVKIRVPKSVANKYNGDNEIISYKVGTYEVKEGQVNSIVDLANDIMNEYWIFDNCGKNPNEIASDLERDNPSLCKDGIVRTGTYQLYYHDTKNNIDKLIEDGKLPSNGNLISQ